MSVMSDLPATQKAVQLVGPGQLVLNDSKAVHSPGPRQILARVEAVGLCFSDLKLLKQFSSHPRKGEIVSGLEAAVLAEIPSYVPGEQPVVPGHEAVCRIVAVGDDVRHHKVGERVLVQTDYRELKTAGSNAAFGYNFEGGLQEYVLMDERVIMEPNTGERFLIPVPEHLGASAVCLVEPWACVEDSYVSGERRAPKAGGRMLIVAADGAVVAGLGNACREGLPAEVVAVCSGANHQKVAASFESAAFVESLEAVDGAFDDVVYFGSDARTIEALNDRLGARGIINIVLGGRRIDRQVSVAVGRVHYGMTRWIGTVGPDAAESYKNIPATGEIRPGDSIIVIGAGGPMGQMHVIRNLCSGTEDISLTLTDVDAGRMQSLLRRAEPIARRLGVNLQVGDSADARHDYFALMAPVAQLVADAVTHSNDGAIINIFTGIPAQTRHEIDLNTYIQRRCFMFGTSGSVIRDMRIVLDKISNGSLDTDGSVDAVSGMAGALEGLKAVEDRTLAGKIIVYPCLRNMGLIPLSELKNNHPSVAAKLNNGLWCKSAEEQLLKTAT